MPDYKRAILVGNSKFASLPGLRCPGEDVEAMKQVLTDENICWFSPVYALLDAPHNEIFTRINEVLRDADKEDLVLIYYSGHGLLDNRGRLYLAASNTDPSLLHATAVSVSAIHDCLSQSRCQRFVLILDCCYAGAGVVRLDELYSYVKDRLAGEGRQEPLRWVSGSAASFIISRTPRSRQNL